MSRDNALLDTKEQGARARIVKGARSMNIVISEQGAQCLSVKRQRRTNWANLDL